MIFIFRNVLFRNIPTTINAVVPSGDTIVWVGTDTGHLFGFSSITYQVLTSVKEHTCISSIVEINNFLVIFGEWTYENVSEQQQDIVRGFSVWKSHHHTNHII